MGPVLPDSREGFLMPKTRNVNGRAYRIRMRAIGLSGERRIFPVPTDLGKPKRGPQCAVAAQQSLASDTVLRAKVN